MFVHNFYQGLNLGKEMFLKHFQWPLILRTHHKAEINHQTVGSWTYQSISNIMHYAFIIEKKSSFKVFS